MQYRAKKSANSSPHTRQTSATRNFVSRNFVCWCGGRNKTLDAQMRDPFLYRHAMCARIHKMVGLVAATAPRRR